MDSAVTDMNLTFSMRSPEAMPEEPVRLASLCPSTTSMLEGGGGGSLVGAAGAAPEVTVAATSA